MLKTKQQQQNNINKQKINESGDCKNIYISKWIEFLEKNLAT